MKKVRSIKMKKFSKVTLLFALTFALSLIACDDKEDEPPVVVDNPKNQSQTITFGANLSTTVTGHMTDEQWSNVIGKLTTALNAAANAGGTLGPRTSSLFSYQGGINIGLVKTTEYSYYKLDVPNLTILLNADYAIGATQDDLSAKINLAINAGAGDGDLQQ
jgi:hypothetical protein